MLIFKTMEVTPRTYKAYLTLRPLVLNAVYVGACL